ncbi:hypothetical protein DW119_07875 [Bifidobacterium pseudocatenulatum]|uniref:Uncharacterized protein n=1 Tax=Bifidobacterium pseudocatenulatum TaxID=28026 RepID=A0A413KCE5_BIFPS|nr:hypothetical protein DXA22_06240 [Bifidobacterium pseudocatenulatum]RHJ48358.1 hypothetical protein DW119_07875 [Bifidobacterium pseudocatenulatum]
MYDAIPVKFTFDDRSTKEIPRRIIKKLAKYYHLDFNDGHFTFIFTLPMGNRSHYLIRNRNL